MIPAWDFTVDDWLHSRMAIMRGVENGFSEIRTARLGRLTISDCYGRVTAEAKSSKGNAAMLAGDVRIQNKHTFYARFGNWFGIIRSFIPSTSVFELTTPFRTKNDSLLGFWNKVRAIEDDIAEVMARNGYSTVLDKTLFETQGQDEIILCLNYDGLYGINNINRFLQSSNPGAATTWRVSTYKIGDPVLFNETERFRPVIYNNLKGRIVGIEHVPGHIQFDVELDRMSVAGHLDARIRNRQVFRLEHPFILGEAEVEGRRFERAAEVRVRLPVILASLPEGVERSRLSAEARVRDCFTLTARFIGDVGAEAGAQRERELVEARPEGLGLGRADLEADDLAPAIGVDRHGDYGRDR